MRQGAIGVVLWAFGCTVEVPVGIDPVRPTWSAEPRDGDRDGVVWQQDCDDANDRVGEPAPERCDLQDNDCDGQIDEGEVCLREERFVQEGTVDMLLVVDPRGPAADLRTKLRAALPQLLGPLADPWQDVHVGVLSMDAGDPAHRGRLVDLRDGALFISSEDQDPADRLGLLDWAIRDLAVTPERPFRGPLGARFVTEQMLRVLEGFNGDFRRSSSFLSLVYVTSTEDQSPEPAAEALADFLDELQGRGRWAVSAIVQVGELNCADKVEKGDEGVSFSWLVDRGAGGARLHHCTPEYGSFAAGVSEELAGLGLHSEFDLEATPVVGSVEVRVVTARDLLVLEPHEFQVQGRRLVLDPPPPADADVLVRYREDPTDGS